MRLFSWKGNKFKILNITVLSFKNTSESFKFYFLGIPCYKHTGSIPKLISEFKLNRDFDTRIFDKKIETLTRPFIPLNSEKDNRTIGFLATSIFDMGGHSKSIKDLLHSLSDNYKQILFLTQISTSITHAPKLFNEIKKYSKIYGIDSNLLFLRKKCKNFCQEIVHNHIKVLLVYIHPDDVFGAAVLAYLKNTTDIKIIYVNHASHYPVLGMSFADVILEGTRTTEEITQRKRHFKNTKIIGLQSLHKNETVYYSTEVLKELRESLGIQPHNVISMSGGSAYKFFDGDKSAYLQMIKRLLIKDSNLVHIIITQLNQIQKRILENIFIDTPHIRRRLIILPFQANFDKWFQIADLFIDSFPISSALTQVDLMRNKVPPVVKINIERPEFSFHEYQSENYPYMFEKVEDMEKSILTLLYDKKERDRIVKDNYAFWLKTYESGVYKNKIISIINVDNHE